MRLKIGDVDPVLVLLYINEEVLPEMQKYSTEERVDKGIEELWKTREELRPFLESVGLDSHSRTWLQDRLAWSLRQAPPLIVKRIVRLKRTEFPVVKLTLAGRKRAADTIKFYPDAFHAAAIQVFQSLYFRYRGSKEED